MKREYASVFPVNQLDSIMSDISVKKMNNEDVIFSFDGERKGSRFGFGEGDRVSVSQNGMRNQDKTLQELILRKACLIDQEETEDEEGGEEVLGCRDNNLNFKGRRIFKIKKKGRGRQGAKGVRAGKENKQGGFGNGGIGKLQNLRKMYLEAVLINLGICKNTQHMGKLGQEQMKKVQFLDKATQKFIEEIVKVSKEGDKKTKAENIILKKAFRILNKQNKSKKTEISKKDEEIRLLKEQLDITRYKLLESQKEQEQLCNKLAEVMQHSSPHKFSRFDDKDQGSPGSFGSPGFFIDSH